MGQSERKQPTQTPSSFINHKGGSLALISDKVKQLMTAAYKTPSGDKQESETAAQLSISGIMK